MLELASAAIQEAHWASSSRIRRCRSISAQSGVLISTISEGVMHSPVMPHLWRLLMSLSQQSRDLPRESIYLSLRILNAEVNSHPKRLYARAAAVHGQPLCTIFLRDEAHPRPWEGVVSSVLSPGKRYKLPMLEVSRGRFLISKLFPADVAQRQIAARKSLWSKIIL